MPTSDSFKFDVMKLAMSNGKGQALIGGHKGLHQLGNEFFKSLKEEEEIVTFNRNIDKLKGYIVRVEHGS